MARVECGADVVEVGHRRDVNPCARNGDDHVGEAEAKRLQQQDRLVAVAHVLAEEVLAGDAEMDLTVAERGSDLGRRHQLHVDAWLAFERRAIIARARRLLQVEPGIGEIVGDLLLEPAFGGDGEDEGLSHYSAPVLRRAASTRSLRMAAPTAGTSRGAPSVRISWS